MEVREYKLGKHEGFRAYIGGIAVSRKPVSVDMAIAQAKALEHHGEMPESLQYALNDDDIHKMIPTLSIKTYQEILGARTLDDILDAKGRLILLYLTTDAHTGHWVALLKKHGVVEFCDSYGIRPDGEGKWLTPAKLKQLGQASKHLSALLNACPYKVVWNNTKLQSDKSTIATCGRHALTRLYFKHLPLAKYVKMLKLVQKNTGMTPDEFVVGFTSYFIGH